MCIYFIEMEITSDIFLEMTHDHIRELAGDLKTSVQLSSVQRKLKVITYEYCTIFLFVP